MDPVELTLGNHGSLLRCARAFWIVSEVWHRDTGELTVHDALTTLSGIAVSIGRLGTSPASVRNSRSLLLKVMNLSSEIIKNQAKIPVARGEAV